MQMIDFDISAEIFIDMIMGHPENLDSKRKENETVRSQYAPRQRSRWVELSNRGDECKVSQ